jgi:isoquinoline 1-oxidoreductase beta subunit
MERFTPGHTRRSFIGMVVATAAGLSLGFRTSSATTSEKLVYEPFDAFLSIAPDGSVTITTPDAEMGQGIFNSLPMLVAEELDVAWEHVRVKLSGADDRYRNPRKPIQSSGDSAAIRGFYWPLRQAGAAAREMLIGAAARRWSVDVDSCETAAGTVLHRPSGRSLGYGELATDARDIEVPKAPCLKPPSRFHLIGHSPPRKDTLSKVDGTAIYAGDIRLPGMLFAALRQAPVPGARLEHFDTKAALRVTGVRNVVPLADAVAVVADSWWQATRGLAQGLPRFSRGSTESDWAAYRDRLIGSLDQAGRLARETGGPPLGDDAGTIAADYVVPYLAHATMEPMSCVADFADARCTLWAPSQTPGLARDAAAKALGLSPQRVTLHRTFLGGGFGRRFQSDFVVQCALISRAVSRPVSLLWSREEDFAHDFYRPAYAARLQARLDGTRIDDFRARIAGPSIIEWALPGFLKGAVDTHLFSGMGTDCLTVRQERLEHVQVDTVLPIGVWRSVANSQNTFFMESFIDECAFACGVDPLHFRREHYRESRLVNAIDTAAALVGWGTFTRARNHALGIAGFSGYGSHIALIADVSNTAGAPHVHRVTAVVDCGVAVDPRNIEAQIESAICFGLSAALTGQTTFAAGVVQESNFHQHPILRIGEMPEVEVHLIPSDLDPGGVGELGTPPIAPAVCNAWFALTGERIRRLPIRHRSGRV